MTNLRNKMYDKYMFYKKELRENDKEIKKLIEKNKEIISGIKRKKRMGKLFKNAKNSFTDINKIFYI